MMKQLSYLILLLAVLCGIVACSAPEWPGAIPPRDAADTLGGFIDVQLKGSGYQTRATTTVISKEEAKRFLVTITKGSMVLHRQTELQGVVHLTFPVGSGYSVFVESISELQAEIMNDGWGAKRFAGTSRTFSIQAGKTTPVVVPCKVANAAVDVKMPDDLPEGYTVTITHEGRTLTTTESRTAYFNVPPTSPGEEPQQVTVAVTLTDPEDNVVYHNDEVSMGEAVVKDFEVEKLIDNEGNITLSITFDETFDIVNEIVEIPNGNE